MRNHRSIHLLYIGMFLALLLVACGDSTPTMPAPTQTTAATTTVAGPPAGVTSGAAPATGPINTKTLTYQGANWTVFNSDVLEANADNKLLTLTLKQRAGWAGNNIGPVVYKLVTGNFRATATVKTSKTSDPAQPPTTRPHLGGIMARNPNGVDKGGVENYVHIVIGATPNGAGVETKTTVNNDTKYEASTWDTNEAELRICRINDTFSLYKKHVGEKAWTLATSYSRSDLPPTLQVGANIYSFQPPDLRVTFDNLKIEEAVDKTSCEQG